MPAGIRLAFRHGHQLAGAAIAPGAPTGVFPIDSAAVSLVASLYPRDAHDTAAQVPCPSLPP